ncbi:heparan-alpha-glucosaminide N-acetyltransferase [Chironomus tepperi]|uniref:heparan-alpha-glucosaminide N-acetyltransferase n=1 Tax=Chironomus tepperi TaxID=113505 RepID=UPI00391EE72A
MSWIEWTDNKFRGLDLTQLKVDQAYLNISNQQSKKYFLYSLSEQCIKCPFRFLKAIRPENDTLVKLNVDKGFELRLFWKDHGQYVDPKLVNDDLFWSDQPDFGEFGVYDLLIKKTGPAMLETAKEPVNTLTSILFISIFLISFYWICKFINIFFISRPRNAQEATENPIQESTSDNELDTSKAKKRLKSLDIFRGVAIVLMIFVNSGGGHYWWIEHAVWNGLHFADLVFPWFLFIMGVCIPLSIKSQVNRQVAVKSIVKKIIKRSITLFFLGLCLNTLWGATFQNIRIFGVLQRFGVAYLVVSLIHLTFMNNSVNAETRFQQLFYDVRMIWRQWLVILSFIAVYLIFIFGVNAPNCDRGYNGPGGIHEYMSHKNCTGGIAGYIDRTILGVNHLYQRAKIRSVYDALPFDPEGLFGCIMTCVQVFLGVQCGVTLVVYPTAKERLRRWILWGLALLALTCILTLFSVNDGFIPINKNLWSLSFVSVTSSLAFLLLSLIYFLVDVKNIGDDFWTIFLYPGMNAIVLYVGHSVFHSMWPFHWSLDVMNTHFVLLLENLYTVIIWILISHWMYHKKIFINV